MKAKTGAVIIAVAAWLSLLGLTWWMLLDGRIHPLAALITFVVVAAGAGAIAAEGKDDPLKPNRRPVRRKRPGGEDET